MTWETIAAVLGGVLLVGNVGAVVFKILRPALSVKKDVEELKEHDKKDYTSLQHIQEMNTAQCKAMLCMINHMIDGNGIQKMKETRDLIVEIITDKK